jgi:hypothetical protein
VRRLEALGLGRAAAIRRAAGELGVDRDKVRWCVEAAAPGSAVRLSPLGGTGPAGLAVAA